MKNRAVLTVLLLTGAVLTTATQASPPRSAEEADLRIFALTDYFVADTVNSKLLKLPTQQRDTLAKEQVAWLHQRAATCKININDNVETAQWNATQIACLRTMTDARFKVLEKRYGPQ